MIKKELLKKQIIYRSIHRGTKEMDILLGNFVNKHINDFSITELKDLEEILMIDDDVIFNWYFNKSDEKIVPNNKISEKLKKFRF